MVLLLLRFGMRALGVRPDVALPDMVYGVTAPLAEPFYRLFPLPVPYGDRFDIAVIEPASLVAAGVLVGVAVVVYVAGISYLSTSTSQGE